MSKFMAHSYSYSRKKFFLTSYELALSRNTLVTKDKRTDDNRANSPAVT